MLKNYFTVALRNLLRQKIYSIINISGLAVGLAMSMLISLWIIDEVSYDQYPKSNLYRIIVEQKDESGEYLSAITQFPLAEALKSEFPEVINSARYYSKNSPQTAIYGNHIFKINNIGYADRAFLKMFSLELETGNINTALNDINSIILSKEEASKYFGQANPLGKMLTIDHFGTPRKFVVTGVIKESNSRSHLNFDALIPFQIFSSLYEGVNGWEYASNYYTYVELNNNISIDNLKNKLRGFLTKYVPQSKDKLLLQPVKDIHLTSNIKFDSPTNVDIKYIYIFALIAAFISSIACINFMNLSTARAEKRAREIGLRKVIGAKRRQIIALFYGETIWYTLTAFFFSIIMVEISLPFFNQISGKNITIVSVFSGEFIFILGLLAIVTSLVAGSYPALFLSSFSPLEVLKRQPAGSKKGSLFRKSIITLQFALSTFMIIATLVVSQQIDFLQNYNLGFAKENIVYLPIPRSNNNIDAMKNELLGYTDIVKVGSSNILPVHGNESNFNEWEGNAGIKNVLFNITTVDFDYLQTLGIKLSQGRYFDRNFPGDLENACIVNEEAVKQMGMENPIGKKLQGYNIIGVVKDYSYMSLHNRVEPIFLRCNPQNSRYIYIRVNSANISLTMNSIEEVVSRYLQDFPFEYHFLDTTIDNLYKTENRSRSLFGVFTFIAIFISILGLFGLLMFVIERRTREIGIRKVLGASVSGIVKLLLVDFIKLVLIANIFAWPAAYFVMRNWLQDYAYRINITPWPFLLASTLAFIIVVLTISFQSIAAALVNPVESIKYE